MKIKLLAGAMTLALTGCSEKAAEQSYADAASTEAAADAGGPNVRVSAAPGVAFNYAYAFRIDDDRIARVQEEHAAACETLGLARCRITGMTYRLAGQNEDEAELRFKLDPAIARKFGREALASVEKAKGVLAEARISGEDVGSRISESQRRSADLAAEIARIEARLKQGGLGDRERTELQQQLVTLREQTASERDDRRAGEAMLATTPMTFSYVGTGGLPGIGYGNPFSDALTMLVRSAGTLLSVVLVAGAALLPWAALFALFLLAWRSAPVRRARRWLDGGERPVAATPKPAA